MNFEEVVLLKQTYDQRHGLQPDTDYESIRKIHGIYTTVMGVERMLQEEKDGLANYYKTLKQQGAPAYYWIIDAIYITSRKNELKKKFEYLIGILKKWRQYGYGYTPSSEETEIVDYFEEIVGEQFPDSHRHHIGELMSSYGAVYVTRLIGSLSQYSKSYAYLSLLKDLLQERYVSKRLSTPELPLGQVTQSLPVPTYVEKVTTAPAVVESKKTTPEPKKERKNRNSPKKDDYVLYGELLISFLLNNNKEAKLNDLYKFLEANGLEYDRNNKDRLFKRIVEFCPAIQKIGYGRYRLNETELKLQRKKAKEDIKIAQ